MTLSRHTTVDLARIRAQVDSRRNRKDRQKRADDSETLIGNRLRGFGFVEVHKVETGRDHRGNARRAVQGDWTFLSPLDGKGGLCEVKSHEGREHADGDRRLLWSDLAEHQPTRLDGYVKAGAWAMLAWVGPHGIALMSWRILRHRGFAPGRSIGRADVLAADVPATALRSSPIPR